MKAENFSLQRYFDRIGFTQPAHADIATVARMMRLQLFAVPFENLDVQAKKVVSLVPEEIVDKIVDRQRGGYCYEVNGLFAMALEALGVQYQFVAARPMFYPVRRPKTHMAIVVTVDGMQWLCDLGFGSYGIRAPMRLDLTDEPVSQDCDTFMIGKVSPREYVVKARVEGQWTNQFGFDLVEQEWIDFVPANFLNSTHPDTIFVQKRLVVLHNEEGRKILVGNTLKTIRNNVISTRAIEAEEEDAVLLREFGLNAADAMQ